MLLKKQKLKEMEIDLIFKGSLLKRELVSIKDFVKIASTLQEVIFSIGKALNSKTERINYDLLIKTRKKGSEVYSLVPRMQDASIEGSAVLSDALKGLSRFNELLQIDVEGDRYSEVIKIIENPDHRNKIYRNLLKLSKPGKIEVILKKTENEKPEMLFYPLKKYHKSLNSWRILETKSKKETIVGALTVMHGDKDKFWAVRDSLGNYVRYRYTEAEEKKYYPLFKNVLELDVLLDPLRKEIRNIYEVKVKKTIELTKLFDLQFKQTLSLTLEFKYDAFFAVNESLNIVSAGKTFKELYSDLYDCLISHLEYFVDSKDPLTKGAELIKEKLLSLIDIASWEGIKKNANR